MESLAQSMSYPGTIGGAVPISTRGNRATSCWRLHHQQQQTQAFEKDGERRARWSYVPLHFLCDELVMAQTQCTTALLVAMTMEERCRRRSSPSTSGSRPREKISSMRRKESSIPSPIHRIQSRLVRLSTELSQGLNPTARNSIRSNF